MKLTDILRCPQTGNELRFGDRDSTVRVEHSDITYPIIDGIVDFCPQLRDTVSASYDKVASRYDAVLTRPNLLRRFCNMIVFGFDDDRTYADTVLSYLPSQFDGVLLDVPVGTGVFTCSAYANFPNATIIGVDWSLGMLRKAREHFEQQGLNNVCLLRADVANLPVGDAAVDLVLSMNGWHVFADKQRAIAQIRRVLREEGRLVACGYVKGVRRLTDWFMKNFGVRNGFAIPPFFGLDDIDSLFRKFIITRRANVKSVIYFEAINEEKARGQTGK